MGQPSFFDNVREWIGGIAFAVYLWAIRMTKDEFWAEQDRDARRAIDEVDTHIHKWVASTNIDELAKCSICGLELAKLK